MKKKAEARKHGGAIFRKSYVKLRKQLMKRLKGLDANILVSVVRQGEGRIRGLPADFFSDWPDTYNRDSWYKTWAKAELADLPIIEERSLKRKSK
jgi:hypothetical protein